MQRSAFGFAVLLLLGMPGCKPTAPEAVGGATVEPAPSPAAVAKPALHPCDLLSDAAVAGAVPGAQPGQHDTGDEGYGIAACRWKAGDGGVALQVFEAGPGGLSNELRASTLENVDLQRPDAATLIRLEQLRGIGDLAGAYVERADAKRGILRSNAVLMVQRGNRLAVLRIPQLAEGDRDEALKAMRVLGEEIAKDF